MQTLIPGLVISMLETIQREEAQPAVVEPHLILLANAKLDIVVMIPTTARNISGRRYFVGARDFSYSIVASQLDPESPVLSTHTFSPRSDTNQTDEELDRKFKRKGQVESVALRTLKLRWALLEPLVCVTESELLFDMSQRRELLAARAREIVADPSLRFAVTGDNRARKVKRGRKHSNSPEAAVERIVTELQRLLNQFWAGGSTRGALIGFSSSCGGRGKPKQAGDAKRGRKNAKQAEQKFDESGINVEQGSMDAQIIKFCYDTWIVRGTTVAMALRRMWTDFYSVAVQQPDGSTKMEWIDVWKRPTRNQFEYWGKKGDRNAEAWRKQLPPSKFDKSYRAIMGSVTDDVYAVGQRGGIDSTPPDIQLVRAIDRLARVGGCHRIIVVDSMFGYIPGFYMGFAPPSSTTVRLALYNAGDSDKKQWLDDLGLGDIAPEDFIPMWFSTLIADNTDLRTDEIKRCAMGINTAIHFVPKLRSDFNSMAESGHHILHRLVDHKLLGTTYGRPADRGEVPATFRARHTMMEAIRETVRAIHVHNTAEIEDNRPIRMRMKEVPPTRLHMTQEMIRIGQVARALHNVDLARRHLLPRHAGTFTAKGVRLHRVEDTEKPEFIKHIVYVSNHPIVVGWCENARRGGKHDDRYFRASFIADPYRPRRIWYVDPQTNELIELTLKVMHVRDPDLPFLLTLPDMVERDLLEAAEAIDYRDARARRVGAMEVQQRAAGQHAEAEYQNAVARAGGEPTKVAMKANKRDNRHEEMADSIFGMPIPTEAIANLQTQGAGSLSVPEHTKSGEGGCAAPASGLGGADYTLPAAPKPKNSLLRAAIAKLADGPGES